MADCSRCCSAAAKLEKSWGFFSCFALCCFVLNTALLLDLVVRGWNKLLKLKALTDTKNMVVKEWSQCSSKAPYLPSGSVGRSVRCLCSPSGAKGGVTTGVVSYRERVNPGPGSEGILLLWMSTASPAQAPLQGEKNLGYTTLSLYWWLADTWMCLGVSSEIIHKQWVWQYTSLDSAKTTALWFRRNSVTEQSLVFPKFVPLHTERITLILLPEQLLVLKN